METVSSYRQRLVQRTLAPVLTTSRLYWVWLGFLIAVLLWGAYAYSVQYREGLVVTGMRDRILWGFYITNFVFFIGISHAGTLISAILRVSQAAWRTPVTRMAEFITAVALACGAIQPLLDLGRPDRVLNMFIHGRWQSPLVWDLVAITTYFTASIVYLFLPMLPDLALFRDEMEKRGHGFRARVYGLMAIGWSGTAGQKRRLALAMTIMMILIIPIAVSVHTVVSWIFAMTLRDPWDSTIFGIFFVTGAIFSGIAVLIIVMAILRKVYHLEEYITQKQFVYLGYLLAAMAMIMLYGNISEFVTVGYKMNEATEFHFRQLFTGEFAGFYWYYFVGGLLMPPLLMLLPFTRNITGVVTASALVVVAMWIERYFIVVSGLRIPLMDYEASNYAPTWVEISLMAATFALFALLISVFIKVFPILAVWEIVEEYEPEVEPVTAPDDEPSSEPPVAAPQPVGGGS